MYWKLTVIEKISFCKCGVFSKEAIVNLCIIEEISPQSLENILRYSPTILDQIGYMIQCFVLLKKKTKKNERNFEHSSKVNVMILSISGLLQIFLF